MSNFQTWLNEADMPERVNGQWVDLETGIPYVEAYRPRQALSTKAQDARAIAKAFGGKALKGSAKQKEWAENIRAEKLAAMSPDQAEMACEPSGLLTDANFWIERRDRSGAEIGAFVQQQKALLKKAKTLKAAGKAAEYAATAAEYNALTEAWLPKKEERFARRR